MAKAIKMPVLDWDAPTVRLVGESRAEHLRRYQKWIEANLFRIAVRNAIKDGAALKKKLTASQRRAVVGAFGQGLGLAEVRHG